MIPKGFEYRHQKTEHHWVLVGVAVLFSALLHVLFIYFCGDWSFTGLTNITEKSREWLMPDKVPPMRVETLSTDPMRIMDKVPGERDTPSRGPIEVSDRVKELSQESSPALTAPPPIPREALSPGVPALSETSVDDVDTSPWMPRQEIKQIFDRTVKDEAAMLPRREIPMVERIPDAPDITPSIDLAGRKFGREVEPPRPLKAAEVFDTEIVKGTFVKPEVPAPAESSEKEKILTENKFADKPGDKRISSEKGKPGIKKEEPPVETPSLPPSKSEEEKLVEKTRGKIKQIEEKTEYKLIDNLLAVGLETYTDPNESERLYFRIGIQPRTDKSIPVVPKDILWVQDVSASMTEERLRFCRKALHTAMSTMNPKDRFNIIAFRDKFESCFPGWSELTPESRKKATDFISSMRSFGQTDVFGSLRSLLKYERDPLRPMIAFVVTDGKPTIGLTGSSKIIASFSELNSGLMSVYMYGTHKKANDYLLDMLTYCNRGKAVILDGSRWDIPQSMLTVVNAFRDPVLGDISVTFSSESRSEVYPRKTSNLYKEQQIQLIGICPAGTEELVFQVRGLAAGKGYDSVFRLNIKKHGKSGSRLLKEHWARQKMFYLAGDYSVNPHQQTFAEMLKINKKFGVEIPYKIDLK
ncbi:MAG: VWA domain-containing protein [Kiritimatiellia bacterium]